MAKVPKHKRIKRATVLIKRTRCIKNSKKDIKAPSLLYQKLKINNRSLAKALAQERQEYQLIFTRNNELLAEVQDLAHACNKRDLIISNILKNSKEMMQMLVTMSGFLTNVISSCQEFVSNQVPHRTSSSSSTGRRESTRRTSMKSPNRGVVKPMVSGHTITKPTVNLSRVNMQRLPPNSNLSIIEESSTSERNSDGSIPENRRSRSLSERIPVPPLSSENDEERAMLRRRSNRYSGARSSSGRYSKRNSGRLSGGCVVVGRLSRELLKSPCVTLQDVSRYLTNNQSINVRLFSKTANGSNANGSSSPENTQPSEPSSPEENDQANRVMVHTESQDDSEPQNTSESETENIPVQQPLPRKSTMKSVENKIAPKRSVRFENFLSSTYDSDDPLEGSSWYFDSILLEEDEDNNGRNNQVNTSPNEPKHNSSTSVVRNSPVSSLSTKQRHSSGKFRVPDLPKRFIKPPAASRLNPNNEFDLSSSRVGVGLETSSSYANHNGDVSNQNGEDDNEDDEDDDCDRRRNLCFITRRRGHINDDDEDDEDDDTMLINMQRQLQRPQANFQEPQQQQSPEQSERMQFDLNELLQLTPLKPLLKINCAANNEPVQPEPEAEPTVTIQLTQRIPPPLPDETLTTSRMSTIKVPQSVARNQDAGASSSNAQEPRRFSELSTTRLSTRVELPRLTELHNTIVTESSQQPSVILTHVATDDSSPKMERRKRNDRKQNVEEKNLASEEEEETPKKKKKEPKQCKKKSDKKDPSCAKVVLQKLSSTNGSLSKLEHKNSDESTSSMRSSIVLRVDPSSDSECSSTSNNNTSTRPRRQKAPKNLQEPNMKKKMRR